QAYSMQAVCSSSEWPTACGTHSPRGLQIQADERKDRDKCLAISKRSYRSTRLPRAAFLDTEPVARGPVREALVLVGLPLPRACALATAFDVAFFAFDALAFLPFASLAFSASFWAFFSAFSFKRSFSARSSARFFLRFFSQASHLHP